MFGLLWAITGIASSIAIVLILYYIEKEDIDRFTAILCTIFAFFGFVTLAMLIGILIVVIHDKTEWSTVNDWLDKPIIKQKE